MNVSPTFAPCCRCIFSCSSRDVEHSGGTSSGQLKLQYQGFEPEAINADPHVVGLVLLLVTYDNSSI